MGVLRNTFYRYKEPVDERGLDSFITKSRQTPNLKKSSEVPIEQSVIRYAINFPSHGQH